MPAIEAALPHLFWQLFETISVIFFTIEYMINVLTAVYDPKWGFNRYRMMTSFTGISDILVSTSYIVFYVLP